MSGPGALGSSARKKSLWGQARQMSLLSGEIENIYCTFLTGPSLLFDPACDGSCLSFHFLFCASLAKRMIWMKPWEVDLISWSFFEPKFFVQKEANAMQHNGKHHSISLQNRSKRHSFLGWCFWNK